MSHGFDLENPLVCEGIIGDGCGGGRIFMLQDGVLKAYDPQTREYRVLYSEIKDAVRISKSACIITITCKEEVLKFDLSALDKV